MSVYLFIYSLSNNLIDGEKIFNCFILKYFIKNEIDKKRFKNKYSRYIQLFFMLT